ncbi:MAG: NINE protein [Alphaproteobacteria bacterium]
MIQSATQQPQISDKSYGTAVALSAVFGIVGIHHFYLGNILHGLFDLGLFILSVSLYAYSIANFEPSYMIWAGLFFLVDAIHTIFVTIKLLIGAERDGQGKIVAYPGQFKNQSNK